MRQEIFPNLGRHIAASRLEADGDDVEKSIEYFLQNPPNEKKAPQKAPGNWKQDMDLSTQLKLKTLQEKFFWAEPEIVKAIFHFNDCNLGKSIQELNNMYPSRVILNNKPKPGEESPVPVSKKQSTEDNTETKEQYFKEIKKTRKEQSKFSVVAPKRKPQGPKPKKSPNAGKTAELADASYHAELRNQYFRQAAQAYLAGDGARAAEFSALVIILHQVLRTQGRQHAALMAEAQRRACEDMLENGIHRGNSVVSVDLHGLHVQEALDVVEEMLHRFSRAKGTHLLYIITGVGHHSVGGKARIKPALKSYLSTEGYRFSEAKPGAIVVQLKE